MVRRHHVRMVGTLSNAKVDPLAVWVWSPTNVNIPPGLTNDSEAIMDQGGASAVCSLSAFSNVNPCLTKVLRVITSPHS